jgi:hypothetical protein
LPLIGLKYCNIKLVSVEIFAKLSALEWLEMSENNLRTVHIKIWRAGQKLRANRL